MHILRLPLPELLLRAGLAFAFLYPPLSAFTDPYSWIGYFPAFLIDFVAPHGVLLLHALGVVEIGLALWILFARNVFVPSIVAAVMLLAIVLVNPNQFPILFRDVSIALMAVSLAFMHRPKAHAG